MLYCTSSHSFKFFCSFRYSCALYYFSTLILLTVFSIIILFSTVYTSSFFKPLLLLWSLLKCLLLLESLVWPLLLQFLSIIIFISGFPWLVSVSTLLGFSCTTKIYWFQSFIPLSWGLLRWLVHWYMLIISLVGLLSLIDPVINFDHFVN